MFRNFKLVDKVIFGNGSINQLDAILNPHRKADWPMIFFVDHFFENNQHLLNKIPKQNRDQIIFADVTHEPKTSYIDALRDDIQAQFGSQVAGIVGIGGGSTLDIAKAVSLMLTNKGSSTEYQGWDLIKNPAIYHVGIPTLSGTGAEVSRTCVLTGPTKKLGLNSDYTVFDQIVLDPSLIANAPKNQRFYTGMDCYIHCIESLEGTFLNTFSKSYGEQALSLCRKVFLEYDAWTTQADEELMMASYAGGMSIAYSQVGVAHALSYGLSYVMGTKHGIGNCIVFNHLEEFYPTGVQEFKKMLTKHQIDLPVNYTAHLSNQEMETMITVALGLAPLWENALGKDWAKQMPRERVKELYQRL